MKEAIDAHSKIYYQKSLLLSQPVFDKKVKESDNHGQNETSYKDVEDSRNVTQCEGASRAFLEIRKPA